MTTACVNGLEEILWALNQARMAPDERRQRLLDHVAQNRETNGPIDWVFIGDWSEDPTEDTGEDPAPK
jgi:hypothetical protein